MTAAVLDASALLALILGEPGSDKVPIARPRYSAFFAALIDFLTASFAGMTNNHLILRGSFRIRAVSGWRPIPT
jgi:PIN domain nuclease of toxin-antitoxin system